MIALLALAAVPSAAAEEVAVDVELFLAVDASSSIDPEEAALQRAGYAAAFADPSVISALLGGKLGRVAVRYVEYAGDREHRLVADWTEIASEADARAFSEFIRGRPTLLGNLTGIGAIIEAGRRSLRENRFVGRRVIDISGDGFNNGAMIATRARDWAVADGVTINGLPVRGGRSTVGSLPERDLTEWYVENVIGGPNAFVETAASFADFARAAKRKLIRETAAPGIAAAVRTGNPPPD